MPIVEGKRRQLQKPIQLVFRIKLRAIRKNDVVRAREAPLSGTNRVRLHARTSLTRTQGTLCPTRTAHFCPPQAQMGLSSDLVFRNTSSNSGRSHRDKDCFCRCCSSTQSYLSTTCRSERAMTQRLAINSDLKVPVHGGHCIERTSYYRIAV